MVMLFVCAFDFLQSVQTGCNGKDAMGEHQQSEACLHTGPVVGEACGWMPKLTKLVHVCLCFCCVCVRGCVRVFR